MRQLRWKIAAVIVAAIAIVTAVTVPQWTASADGERWAAVHIPSGQVLAVVKAPERDPYRGARDMVTIQIPEGVTVRPLVTRFVDGNFVDPAPVANTPTPTPDAGGTAPPPTVEPTATPVPATPTPTATPDPDAMTLEDLQAQINTLQLEVIDLRNRLSAAEVEIATLKGP
jgi:hypothetical protein